LKCLATKANKDVFIAIRFMNSLFEFERKRLFLLFQCYKILSTRGIMCSALFFVSVFTFTCSFQPSVVDVNDVERTTHIVLLVRYISYASVKKIAPSSSIV